MGVFAVGLQSASQFPFVWARCVTEEKPKMSAFSAWPGGGPGGLPPGFFSVRTEEMQLIGHCHMYIAVCEPSPSLFATTHPQFEITKGVV